MPETTSTTTTNNTLVGGWHCRRCTFHHHAPGTRCVMCQELRVSREEMRDFVTGNKTSNHKATTLVNDSTHHEVVVEEEDGNNKENGPLTEEIVVETPLEPLVPRTAAAPAASTVVKAPSRPSSNAFNNPYARKKSASAPATRAPPPLAPLLPPHTDEAHDPGEAASNEPSIDHGNAARNAATTTSRPTSAPTNGPPPLPQPQQQRHVNSVLMMRSPQTKGAKRKLPPVNLVYEPGPVPLDERVKEWCFPVHPSLTKRQYQLEICKSAIFHNTLVSLPTGLGKTLIAAVVLYNYYHWFPTGKVLFLAPTLPLVHQQVRACFEIMGIPVGDTAVLTGKLAAAQRKRIWHERRVFFCTPQTVLRDLEAGSANPAQIVCVVFDEAHKATGDYAYTKIVQLLLASAAKPRLVGLSATPGPNLKAIQGVVDALLINKIEARHDSDPDVATYLHVKQMEIVVVPQIDAARHVQGLLNDLIGPILEKLKQQGASRLVGIATVTAFGVLKAQQEYSKRPDAHPGVSSHFYAAHALVQLRSDLNQHGVGLVRTKIQRLRMERQRGVLATLVQSKPFGVLWDAVVEATASSQEEDGGDHHVPDSKSLLRNNPKLNKLQEILTEHFARARACQKSSRAIVFSQFRDSVQEIVCVLRALPSDLLRARHFIGQGKGSAKKMAARNEAGLRGMKQSEQQEVLREFRDDIHNVLVCTCIAEEGLDVGEVDLIVNFDTLRSPIRTIQRTGRTGRKRDGRVVCLVAQGQEERTMLSSKQAERTLHHALKNPRSFTVFPTVPMFPEGKAPVLVERNMSASVPSFQMSQIEGHDGARRKRALKSAASSMGPKKGSWRLTHIDHARIQAVLGPTPRIVAAQALSLSGLRRRFLAARSLSSSSSMRATHGLTPRRHWQGGRTLQLLVQLERTHETPRQGTVRRRKASESVFPMDALADAGPAVPCKPSKNNAAACLPTAVPILEQRQGIDPATIPARTAEVSSGEKTTTVTVKQRTAQGCQPVVVRTQEARTVQQMSVTRDGRNHMVPASLSTVPHPDAMVAGLPPATRSVPVSSTTATATTIAEDVNVPDVARALSDVRASGLPFAGNPSVEAVTRDHGQPRLRPVIQGHGPASFEPQVRPVLARASSETTCVDVAAGSTLAEEVPLYAQPQVPTVPTPSTANALKGSASASVTYPRQAEIASNLDPSILADGALLGAVDEFFLEPPSSSSEDDASDEEVEENTVNPLPILGGAGGAACSRMAVCAPSEGSASFQNESMQRLDSSASAFQPPDKPVALLHPPPLPTSIPLQSLQESPPTGAVSIERQEGNCEEDVFCIGTQESSSDESGAECNMSGPEKAKSLEDSFSLAPPEPSSDEESVDDNDCGGVVDPVLSVLPIEDMRVQARGTVVGQSVDVMSPGDDGPIKHAVKPKKRGRIIDDSFSLAPPEPSSDEESVDDNDGGCVADSALPREETRIRAPGTAVGQSIDVDSPGDDGPIKRATKPTKRGRIIDDSSLSAPSPAVSLARQKELFSPNRIHVDFPQRKSTGDGLATHVDQTASHPTSRSSAEHGATSTADDEGPIKACRKRRKDRVVFIDDTSPSQKEASLAIHYPSTCFPQSASLTNTPVAHSSASQEDIVCAVCHSPESLEEDPIILCDGPGGGEECDLAVHSTCYSVLVDPDPDKEWRCDRCEFYFRGNRENVLCSTCMGDDGALKRISPNEWRHPHCRAQAIAAEVERQENKRARVEPRAKTRKGILERRVRQFFSEEAGINSDEDLDGDEGELDDVRCIEEEEKAHSSFINDGTPTESTTMMHRAVDNQRYLESQLGTPVFNRRVDGTPPSAADSERGLGGMHFIRSILEHHRNGGNADDVETMYQQMEEEESDS